MAEDQGKEEEKFDFTPEGEVLGYISLDQARLLAMSTAGETPGDYGRRFRDVPMALEVETATEEEDSYTVTLSFRPQGDFPGTPGQEQFFIEKEGTVAVRQVLSLPRLTGERRFPLLPVAIGLVMVGVIAAVAAVFMLGGTGDDGPLVALAIDEYTTAIQLDPDYAGAYYDRGIAYSNLGQHQRAIEDYDQAIQLDPDYALAYAIRSVSYRSLGQSTKADADKATACSLDSEYC